MILVTGASGQIGSDLVGALRARHGAEAVLETDLHDRSASDGQDFLYEPLDVTDGARLRHLVERYDVHTIYHLASLLSAVGEEQPDLCWRVNVEGLRNVLDAARAHHLKVFWPSSIAVFGPHTPKHDTPQITIGDPSTMYGITKVSGELLCRYYALHFGVDVRSVRLPGIISYTAPPGGGTTDYAVEIFHEALRHGAYACFVRAQTCLPMMYMPDALKAILDIMAADPEAIKIRSSYNIAAVSFTAEALAAEIRKHLPGFTCTYEPDFRQTIAESWPAVIDDSRARSDWGWAHLYDLPALVADMLRRLAPRYATPSSETSTHPS